MPATARLLRCPFIGCRAHRLALFVRHYIGEIDEDDDDEHVHFISKVKKLMKKLRSANKQGRLREAECLQKQRVS
jgi:hypothetical protein